jgi:hypothetical protein
MKHDVDFDEGTGLALRVEAIPAFRMAQMILVLEGAHLCKKFLDLERLSVVEFLSANPFLAVDASSPEASQLRLQGFGQHSITYASPGQRYVTRRERITSDLAQLIAFGLVQLRVRGGQRVFVLTDPGCLSAKRLCSVYADAYRLSVATVIPIVTKLSATKMRESLGGWLRVDPLLFDLIDSPTTDEFQAEVSALVSLDRLF